MDSSCRDTGAEDQTQEQNGSSQRRPSCDSVDLPNLDNGTKPKHKHSPGQDDEDTIGRDRTLDNRDAMANYDDDTDIPDAPPAEDTKSTTFSSPPSKTSGPKKKKKGTASVVRAPKRAPNSSSSAHPSRRGGRGGKKPSQPGGSRRHQTPDGADGASTRSATNAGSESDSGPYCICRGPDNHRFMISCDRCEDWFHGECIGLDKFTGENLIQSYICPGCSDGGRYVTRFKKMCALEKCALPARIYDPAVGSIFCSDDHAQAWWEQLIATLPKTKAGDSSFDFLTQHEFMGLLETRNGHHGDGAWKLGEPPLGIPPDFWTTHDPSTILTPEETRILSSSAADRHDLGEEILLCRSMLTLLDLAWKRREQAIAAGRGTAKDLCGYDARLDTIGTPEPFRAFLHAEPHGGASILAAGKLEAPPEGWTAQPPLDPAGDPSDALTAGMCIRKKCKPHGGWYATLGKNVKHRMKELASQAREMAMMEERVRGSAARRWQRRRVEENTVERFDSEEEEDGDVEMEG